MALARFFVPVSITPNQNLSLPDKVAHHLAKVLRLNQGDNIILFNGEGGEYKCRIEDIKKNSAIVSIDRFDPINRDASLKVHLGLCVTKKDAMDRAISKSVELGVASITPLISERCTVSKKIIHARESHWQQVIYASCEQCGLNLPPILNRPQSLTDWIDAPHTTLKFIALPDTEPLNATGEPVTELTLLIGPEGGFTDLECSGAADQGFTSVSFGDRVLRAETAPVVCLSVLQYEFG